MYNKNLAFDKNGLAVLLSQVSVNYSNSGCMQKTVQISKQQLLMMCQQKAEVCNQRTVQLQGSLSISQYPGAMSDYVICNCVVIVHYFNYIDLSRTNTWYTKSLLTDVNLSWPMHRCVQASQH